MKVKPNTNLTMSNKKFKDTKVGRFLATAAPTVLDMVGDAFPPVEILANMVNKTSPELKGDPAYEKALEQYKTELEYQIENTKGARNIYTQSKDITDTLANKIMNWNLPLILVLVVLNIVCVRWLDSTLLAIVSNVIGMVMQKLFEERSAVTNFFFGSSQGSKQKDNLINSSKNG